MPLDAVGQSFERHEDRGVAVLEVERLGPPRTLVQRGAPIEEVGAGDEELVSGLERFQGGTWRRTHVRRIGRRIAFRHLATAAGQVLDAALAVVSDAHELVQESGHEGGRRLADVLRIAARDRAQEDGHDQRR